MNKENKLIPQLRFPEFAKEGEWELTSIGKIGKFYYGKSAPKWSLSEDAKTPCVRYGELYTKFGTIITEVKSHTNIEPSDLKFSKGGEILVPRVGERATDFAKNCCYLPYPNIAIGEMISVFETKEFPLFYTHYFRTLWREFAEVVEGQNVKNLYYINLEPIKIGKPSNEEQEKIASCLSSLDEVIAAYSQKLEVLKDHKKGLMQNLFPSAGEKVPKYRFKEFENDGEWEIKELNKLGDLINGLTYSPDDVRENGLLVLRSSNVQNGLIDLNDCVYVRKDIQGANLSKPNDILVCVRNGSKNLIGKNAIIPKGLQLATHGAFMTVFRATNPEFVFQLFQTDFYDTQVKADLGATINSINGKNFLKYEFPIPKNPKEQNKIAKCLSSLDDLVTEQTEKLNLLKLHKTGLLQGLFPKINN
jgi:type I restriction enzyme S subunit